MTLAPLRKLWDAQSEMDRLFEGMLSTMLGRRRGGGAEHTPPWVPPLDAYAREGNLVILADLPGVALEDVEITLEGGMLTISGIRKAETEDVDSYLRELPHGEFRRSVAVPEVADPESVKARLENGVLELLLPGVVAEAPPKKIAIATGGEPGSTEG